MGSDPLGWALDAPENERLNVYALVVYVPDPLGRFLDDLRRELVPNYNPHAHVSVLPPRPLRGSWHDAAAQVRRLTEGWAPFAIELAEVRIFPVTDVVYIEVGTGAATLRELHGAMNTGALEFAEPFLYHPHITLAQEIAPEHVQPVHELACRRWSEFRGPRAFHADRAVFVQNTLNHCWIDLAEYSLGGVGVR